MQNSIFQKDTLYGHMSYFANDSAFVSSLDNGKIYEEEIVLNYLTDIIKSSSLVVDAGAHAGSYVVMMKHFNPELVIHAFEPQKRMFQLLNYNIEKNNLKNVFTYNKALANKSLQTSMSETISDGPNSNTVIRQEVYGSDISLNLGGMQLGHGGESVLTTTIDEMNLDRCDLIKIDTEGAEPLVLMGAQKTIKNYKPFIIFENNYKKLQEDYIKMFEVSENSFDILKSFGYSKIVSTNMNWTYIAYPN